jgi:hypothetical protein
MSERNVTDFDRPELARLLWDMLVMFAITSLVIALPWFLAGCSMPFVRYFVGIEVSST